MVIPLFALMTARFANAWIIASCIVFGYGIVLGIIYATFHLLFVDLFPTHTRSTMFGIVLNTSFACFGGFVGVISQELVPVSRVGPGLYPFGIGILSIAALLWLRWLLANGTVELLHFPSLEISNQ